MWLLRLRTERRTQDADKSAGKTLPLAPLKATDGAVIYTALSAFANENLMGKPDPTKKRSVILVNPESAGQGFYISANQISADLYRKGWKIPPDVEENLRRRNSQVFSLKNLPPEKGTQIVERSGFDSTDELMEAHPDAKALVVLWLPGYASDEKRAVVRFFFYPTPHGAVATYLLELAKGKWIVARSTLAYYA